jgi:hypothetical protein
MSPETDEPPSQTVKPIDPPPPASRPSAAMLKGDIDSGRTGDKNPVHDPGLSPLGTDDEAAGQSPSPFQVSLARYTESVRRWLRTGRPPGAAHENEDGFPFVFVAFIAAVGLVLLVGIALVR